MKLIDWSRPLERELLYICACFFQGGRNDFRQVQAAVMDFL